MKNHFRPVEVYKMFWLVLSGYDKIFLFIFLIVSVTCDISKPVTM